MFKFRLQPVLKYREFLEDQKKLEFAERQRIFLEEKKRGERLREMRAQYHEELRKEAAREDISVTKLSFLQSYIFVIERQIAVQDERTAAAKIELEKAQQALVEAKRQKEVMLRAKENELKKHRKKEELAALKILDEVATIKFVRTNQGLEASAHATRI